MFGVAAQYARGRLLGVERQRFEDHLVFCPACSQSVLDLTHADRERRTKLFSFTEEYVQRLTEGDKMTERHFVDYFSPLVHMKLKRSMWGCQDLEDLRQEVFLRVFKSLRNGPGLRHAERLGAFVVGVCRNVVLEYRPRPKLEQWCDHLPEPRDPAPNVEWKLLTGETLQEIESVLGELPAIDRYLLRALFLEDRDKDEVCRELGIKRSSLKLRLFRAKQRFRQIRSKRRGRDGSAE